MVRPLNAARPAAALTGGLSAAIADDVARLKTGGAAGPVTLADAPSVLGAVAGW